MELFSEIYGCYFTVVTHILEQAQHGLTKHEIEQFVNEYGFYESTFHLLPSLFSGEWSLLKEKNQKYYSRVSADTKRPFTTLEKAWLKALLDDPRITLFLDEKALDIMRQALENIEPLYLQNNFFIYDQHLDGDPFSDPAYAKRFQTILNAIKTQQPLMIGYTSSQMETSRRLYYPYKLCYSARNNKFRLLCASNYLHPKKLSKITLNLARISSVEPTEQESGYSPNLNVLFRSSACPDPIVLEIFKERNALERCMLQFASFERQTEYDKERDIYICRIWYDPADETELLIRILSFGPVVKVLSPKRFLMQIKKRIASQIELLEM